MHHTISAPRIVMIRLGLLQLCQGVSSFSSCRHRKSGNLGSRIMVAYSTRSSAPLSANSADVEVDSAGTVVGLYIVPDFTTLNPSTTSVYKNDFRNFNDGPLSAEYENRHCPCTSGCSACTQQSHLQSVSLRIIAQKLLSPCPALAIHLICWS